MVEKPKTAAAAYYEIYSDYNKLLRSWFVAFGIGAIIALFSQKDLLASLKEAHLLAWIIWPLLLGSLVQVLIAAVNKTCAWAEYRSEEEDQ